jgi:hypothetical protein
VCSWPKHCSWPNDPYGSPCRQRLSVLAVVAGFQVSTGGRIWVSTEAIACCAFANCGIGYRLNAQAFRYLDETARNKDFVSLYRPGFFLPSGQHARPRVVVIHRWGGLAVLVVTSALVVRTAQTSLSSVYSGQSGQPLRFNPATQSDVSRAIASGRILTPASEVNVVKVFGREIAVKKRSQAALAPSLRSNPPVKKRVTNDGQNDP